MAQDLLDYSEVQERLGAAPTLLLGNGFSIACDSRYSYRALRENLEDTLPSVAKNLLERLDTDNVEQVMQILEDARWVNGHFTGDRREAGPLGRQLEEIHGKTCAAMVRAIAKDHLGSPQEIDEQGNRSSHAVAFLDPYARIFTTNYDLLLYWTLMKSLDRRSDGKQKRGNARRWRDGFRRIGLDDYGSYDPEVDINVYYLHGALHLFVHREGDVLDTRKHVSRDDLTLLSIVERTFELGDLPLFVAGGRPEQKLEAISANPYLTAAHDAFAALEGDLVIYGLSLGASDQHLLDALANNSNLGTIYLGLYGDPESAGGLALRATVAELEQRGKAKRGKALDIQLFGSASTHAWG